MNKFKRVHDSMKPAGLGRRDLPNLSESSLAGGLCGLAKQNGPRVSDSEAEDRQLTKPN